jgi:hypothetical protein
MCETRFGLTFDHEGGAMHDNPFQDTDRPYQDSYPPYQNYGGPWPSRCHGRGVVLTALKWGAIAVLALLAFGAVTWAFGLVFSLIGLIFKVALVTAVVAFVWRRVARRNHRSYDL